MSYAFEISPRVASMEITWGIARDSTGLRAVSPDTHLLLSRCLVVWNYTTIFDFHKFIPVSSCLLHRVYVQFVIMVQSSIGIACLNL